jgi:hypothetical protein
MIWKYRYPRLAKADKAVAFTIVGMHFALCIVIATSVSVASFWKLLTHYLDVETISVIAIALFFVWICCRRYK